MRAAHREVRAGFIDEIRATKPDLIYAWGTSVTLGIVGPYDGIVPAQHITDDLFEGLTTLALDGSVAPGVAESWEVSSDGKTWQFQLREAHWSNGDPVTAHDFVYAWRREVDPRTGADITAEQKKLVHDAILQAFFALRETFLEELDLEEPNFPLLISGAHRLKMPGAAVSALVLQDHQRRLLDSNPAPRPDIDALLSELRAKEQDNGGGPREAPDTPRTK
mgnify:CR=1 FL=1